MKMYFSLLIILVNLISCKTGPNADSQYTGDNKKRVYKLKLDPAPGSEYQYEIINESAIKMEVDNKKIDNLNKSEVGFSYRLDKDSAGTFLLHMKYNKVHIYTKNGETETDINTDDTLISDDPVGKMIGALKDGLIEATISPLGEMKSIKGYDEIADKMIAEFTTDAATRNMVKTHWQQTIGEGIIKKNMEQLFKIFPDSAVRAGDKWKLNLKQESELGVNIKSFFTLKHMNDETAIITSQGEIAGDSLTINVSGNPVTSDLQGTQDGEYQVELKTGMMLEGKINSEIDGILRMVGREIPINVKSEVRIKGKKIK